MTAELSTMSAMKTNATIMWHLMQLEEVKSSKCCFRAYLCVHKLDSPSISCWKCTQYVQTTAVRKPRRPVFQKLGNLSQKNEKNVFQVLNSPQCLTIHDNECVTRFLTLRNYNTKISTKLLFWALGLNYLARFKPNQATSSRRDSRAAMRNGDNANGIRTRLYNRVHIAHDQISNQLYGYLYATKWRPSTTANTPSHNLQERPLGVIHHKLEHKAYCYIFLDQAEHSISVFLWHPPQYNLSIAQPSMTYKARPSCIQSET